MFPSRHKFVDGKACASTGTPKLCKLLLSAAAAGTAMKKCCKVLKKDVSGSGAGVRTLTAAAEPASNAAFSLYLTVESAATFVFHVIVADTSEAAA